MQQKRNRLRSENKRTVSALAATAPVTVIHDENAHFKFDCNGRPYAGDHLVFDFWGASRLDERDHIEQSLLEAVEASGATLLHMHLHQFPEGGAGVSGMAVLAESHISIHTWPEKGLATLDIYMCGKTDPEKGFKALVAAFAPGRIVKAKMERGKDI